MSRPGNVSVVVDERVVVKWLHTPAPPPHRGAELWTHLAEVGFDEMPAFHGVDEVDRRVVALVTAFVPGSACGWDWYVELLTEELSSGRSTRAVGLASRLGALAARLHHALAVPSSVIPLPVGWADARREYERGVDALRIALNAPSGSADDSLLRRYDPVVSSIEALALDRIIDVQPIHGDLHVGRMLRTRDRILVTGFDDAPVDDVDGRAELRSPMVDLAVLVQSVDHVGRIVASRRPAMAPGAQEFIADATEALLASYGRIAHIDVELLLALRTIRELRDYAYAARHLPKWLCVPTAALSSLHPQ